MKEKGFKSLTSLEEAQEKFLRLISPIEEGENLPLDKSLDRVTAKNIEAPRPSPHYDRAAMDGYAVRAEDTRGATRTSPRRLKITNDGKVGEGEAIPVSTGERIPSGANAVLKLEDSEKINDRKIEALASLTPGRDVGEAGEDVEEGQTILASRTKLRPSHLSLLRALGMENIPLIEKPRVAICPTGEELVPPGVEPKPGKVVESNSMMVAEYVNCWGGQAKIYRLLTDKKEKLKKDISPLTENHLLVTLGGSSVGARDNIVEIIMENGNIIAHGVAIKPGKPVALGIFKSVPIICLPGYPVAALIDSIFFLKPALNKMLNVESSPFYKIERLGEKIHSTLGKTTITRVEISDEEAFPTRTGGSGVLSSITESDGYVVVDQSEEGLDRGEKVKIFPWK